MQGYNVEFESCVDYVMHFPSKLIENFSKQNELKVPVNLKGSIVNFKIWWNNYKLGVSSRLNKYSFQFSHTETISSSQCFSYGD